MFPPVDWPASTAVSNPDGVQDLQQVVAHGGEVVAVVGLVAAAMAPQVDGGAGVAELLQAGGHALPGATVGRQPVDQKEWDAGIAGPDVGLQHHPLPDLDVEHRHDGRRPRRGIYARRVLAIVASAAAGYLLGTVPCADTAARLATGGMTDLRDAGTGNPGAVNAMAVLGRGGGAAILAADAAKGALACGAGRRLAGSTGAHVAGAAAVVGHCLPVWNGFRGGKGVAVSLGQCAATFPAYMPIDLGVAWAVGKRTGRTLPGTAVASATWVSAGVLWWRRGGQTPGGPSPPPRCRLPQPSAAR